MSRIFALSALICLATVPGLPAGADDLATDARIYTAEDFEQFAPRTALDMINQIPGFAVNDREGGQRGFGTANVNILINGQRVSGKSNSVGDALGRITASSVERIEIVDGTTLDIPGLSGQVANVIAKADGISGTWEWEARIRETVKPSWDEFEVSVAGQRGNLGWTLSAENEAVRRGGRGTEIVTDGNGALVETRPDDFTRVGVRPSVSGSLNWTPTNGHIANLNGSYELWQPNGKEIATRIPSDGGPVVERLFQSSEDEWNSEIGGDYELGVGPGRLKFIGLWRGEHSPTVSRVLSVAQDGSDTSEAVFAQTIDEGETIARAEYAWSPNDRMDWQVAVEGAFNFLESDASFFEGTDFGPLVLDPDYPQNARVEEVRADASVTYSQKLTDKLTLQTSLGIEQSEISQSGAANVTRTFTRPKGFVTGTYTFNEKVTLIGRVERRSGQLNFFDFIASSDINNGTDRDANPELSPQQSWLGELELETDFGKWGAGTIKYYHEEIEDLVERIPLRDNTGMIVGDGVGNTDSASIQGFEFDATLKFDPLGLKGAQLAVNGNYQTSQVDDPLTGLQRRVNNGHVRNWEAEFRHDISGTDWAYGLEAREHRDAATFFLDFRTERYNHPVFANAFIEHKDIYGMTGFLWVGNLLDQKVKIRQDFYDGSRLGPLETSEAIDRSYGLIFEFGLSGSF